MREGRVGSYQIVAPIGEGGMGAVYRAQHVMLGRPAAIKVLLPELSREPEMVTRFFNEARATAQLQHPGIIEVYDFGYCDDGAAFIVMELLEGQSLKDRLAQLGRLPWQHAGYYTRQIAGALAAAHRAQIVHRDLKPDNVFLIQDRETGHERIKVLDFGIAKLATDTGGNSIKTRAGAIMGTPSYMSPQQCRGAGEVDHRADIYSVGCMLFEMVCGRPPFVGEGLGDLLAAHMMEPPPWPRQLEPSVPPELEATILRALSKAEGDRQQSMDELAAELDHQLQRASQSMPAVMVASASAETMAGVSTTTLGASAGQVTAPGPRPVQSVQLQRHGAPGGRRRLPYVVAGAGTLAAIVAVVAVVAGGGKGDGGRSAAAAATQLAPAPAPAAAGAPAHRKTRFSVVELTDEQVAAQAAAQKARPAAAAGGAAPAATTAAGAGATAAPPAGHAGLRAFLRLVGHSKPLLRVAARLLGDKALVADLGPNVVLELESTPSGAEVSYEGNVIGKTPMKMTVERGDYDVTLELAHAGFGKRTVDVPAVIDRTEQIALPPMVQLRLVSKPPGATVTSDGETVGVTPLEVQTPASEDALTFSLHLDGYLDKRVDLTPTETATTTIELERQPQPVVHELDSIPTGAEVVLDGQIVGKTPYKAQFLEDKGKVRAYVLRLPDSKRYLDTTVRAPADKPFKRVVHLRDLCAGRAAEADTGGPTLVNPYDPCRSK